MALKEKDILRKLAGIIRQAVSISPYKSDDMPVANSAAQSHIYGLPYFDDNEAWPVNKSTKRKLDFVLQLVASPQLPLPRGIKLLQFYYDWHKPAIHWRQTGWLVKAYTKIHTHNIAARPHRKLSHYCSLKCENIASLPDWDSLELYLPAVYNYCQSKGLSSAWSHYEAMRTSLIGSSETRSFVGGYPQWIQGDALPYFSNRKARLLLQLDSEELASLQWGNNGSVFLFSQPDKLNEYGFVWQTL